MGKSALSNSRVFFAPSSTGSLRGLKYSRAGFWRHKVRRPGEAVKRTGLIDAFHPGLPPGPDQPASSGTRVPVQTCREQKTQARVAVPVRGSLWLKRKET